MSKLHMSQTRVNAILKSLILFLFFICQTQTAKAGIFSFLKNISNNSISNEHSSIENELTVMDYNINSVNGQTINICSGNFYDSGGLAGDYTFLENNSVTFCSDNGGSVLLNFSAWDISDIDPCVSDYLEIFDGSDNSASSLGKFCETSPGEITSTNSCLHFVFKSNFSSHGAGWEAAISCSQPIGPGFNSCASDTEVGGLVFEDVDLSGTRNPNEPFHKNVTVSIHDAVGQVGSTMTNSNGEYLFTGLNAEQDYRLEFSLPNGYEEGPMGTDSKSSVQFVTAGTCDASLGLLLPDFYCPGTPDFVTPCFVDGDPLGGGTSGLLDVLVSTSVTSSDTTGIINLLAVNSQMGSVWGLGYQRTTQKVFSASFLKRHSGFGPLGIGGIYMTDHTNPSSPTVTSWLDVNSFPSVDVGTDPRTVGTLPANTGVASNDSLAFANVGKIGLGDIDISSDDSTLYAMNLNGNGELLVIDIATKTLLNQIAIPNPSCGDDAEVRPFAVKVFKDEVYIGLVCSGEVSGQLDMKFNVMKLVGNSFVSIADGDLNYTKGDTHTSYSNDCDSWEVWANSFDDIHDLGTSSFGIRWCRNQPILSNIEFDLNDDLILGFADRGGHQLGYQQYRPEGTIVGNGYNGGDVLRMYNNAGTYVLENAGTTAGGGGCGNNSQGPGFGEFYCGENYNSGTSDLHQETSNGGLAILPYENDLIVSAMDPMATWTGGVIWLDNNTGQQTQVLQLYQTTAGAGTYGKGAGIGDIQLLCEPAPITIGNYVWWDKVNNGIQDPGEDGLSGVSLTLTDAADAVLGTTITDANGNYEFNNSNVSGGLEYNTDYKIKLTIQEFQTLSPPDAGNDNIDSDGILNDLTVVAEIKTGGMGESTSNVDFGLIGTAGLGNRVWLDENTDGIQNAGERGIADVLIYLFDQNSNLIDSTYTDANGGYIFKNLPTDDYVVKVESGIPTGLEIIYDEDSGMTSPDEAATVTIPGEGEYVTADFGYNWVSKTETDSPTDVTTTGALGDRVWNDANSNGQQDAGEAGIANVTVNLYNDPEEDGIYDNLFATTTTDANGYYIFDNLVPDAYEFSILENDLTSKNYNTTPTSDPDGDGNNFGKTVVIAPGDVWLGGDFGYHSNANPGDIGSHVYIDVDANGIFTMGTDIGMSGVSVALIDDIDENGKWDKGEPVVATTITGIDGSYVFADLPTNKYVIAVTDVNNVISDMTNSVDPDGGANEYSAVNMITANELNENFGYVPVGHTAVKSLVGNYIYLDADGNGMLSLGDTGLEGVEVELIKVGTSDEVITTTKTNELGLFLFGNLEADDYKVKVNTATIPNGLSNSIDPDGSAPGDNITNTFSLAASTNDLTKDFGYKANTPRTISGTIWEDVNAEGTLDTSENNRFENVAVVLTNTDGNIVAITSTNATGDYIFTGISDGTYTIEVTDVNEVLEGYWDSDGTDSETSPKVVALTGGNIYDVDFGYYQEGASLGNFVWIDENGDGIQDANELGLEGAVVKLEIDYNNDATADVTVAQITNVDGSYGFEKLLLDEDYQGDGTGTEPTYQITVTPPNNAFTETLNTDSGGNDNLDSDVHSGVTAIPQQGQRDLVMTNVTETQSSFDFAFEFDCASPSTDYAISSDASVTSPVQTTNYFLSPVNGDERHQSMTQNNGIIRAYNYCVHDGWRYYYNPLDPDEYLFAIRMNAGGGSTFNTTEIEYVELRIDDNANDRYATGATDATFVMMRDWKVKTVNDEALDENVDVRFYFPPNEFQKMFNDASQHATAVWATNAPSINDVVWFEKTDFNPDTDINETATFLNPFDITSKQNAATTALGNNTLDGTMNGAQSVGNDKNHIQFNDISEFGGGTAMLNMNISALPVQLSKFEAIADGCNVRLFWVSDSEENFDRYEIQRSANGQSFETIHQVNGRGGNSIQTYHYEDQEAEEVNYYRLRLVDNDGSVKFSNIVNAGTVCGDEHKLTVYPNPINANDDLLSVKFYSEKNDTQLIITDMLGRKVKVVSLEVDAEWNTVSIDISNLASGTYNIVQTGNGTSQRFVVKN